MAFHSQAGSSSQAFQSPPFAHYGSPSHTDAATGQPQFDILDWYPQYLSCHRYFLDHAQHGGPVRALASFMNILLPCQKHPNPIVASTASSPRPGGGVEIPHLGRPNPFSQDHNPTHAQGVSLIPYIRRLVATGNDSAGVLHGFFGDEWITGIAPLHEIERRNYLFAAKSTSWLKVKQAYDMGPEESIPFLSPLRDASEKEIEMAEAEWSRWLAMQDWMLGPRAPEIRSPRVKRERD